MNLGSGREILETAFNLDRRMIEGVDLLGDVNCLPIRSASVELVEASSILEHLWTPYVALDEIHRVLSPTGTLWVRVPCLGTYSAHADPTHHFLADLKAWREILEGYFHGVQVSSEGVRYRGNRLLAGLNHVAVKVLRFHEFGQTLIFKCHHKKDQVTKGPLTWWMTPSGALSEKFEKS